ncbi:oligoribonuclease [methanotrophic endosymbiont of Bathymodiolus puteoserpentis (Logatchev)]|jgi:oligoribonuclease|uniref:oligoribonuclease n=1 Tax=methanotrophic endosymbiont of Bathymodiolus puteoserpentis (Logatchev) TaxID=343235 RepID=UPI0013CA45D2|nr:oligoribonuclease [methanotrophic endosymbiont of Bathymodiolus puteoserpentis (Logatchev)]SHE20591.1 3'-to-5' oligoribonuclease (orn) [methanotrophic endosymbiont of Bathymodiolus puteoserpentis (Logatchev)]
MTQNAENLIWIDLEMTGLDPDNDLIIEIATVVTDKYLNVLATGPVLAVHQSDTALAAMDDWNQEHHSKSGLIERVKASPVNDAQAEQQTIEFLKQWVPAATSPMCGNSIGQDRRFLYRRMRKLEEFFHYRNLDVSTLKELAARWAPEVKESFKKKETHEALQDVIESIEELKHYREHFIKI